MAYRFSSALGMPITGMTGQNTGNDRCVSYALESGNVRFLLTAPYSLAAVSKSSSSDVSVSELLFDAPDTLPCFSQEEAHTLYAKHGLFARAVGLEVKDARKAFEESVARGATSVLKPTFLAPCQAQKKLGKTEGCYIAEVEIYGDVVLRYVSFPDKILETSVRLPFLPHLAPMQGKVAERTTFGLRRIDHAVGNVPNLLQALNRISEFTGFHEFAEFTTEDVGTVESGLNSVVLASDTEDVLMPLNEPTEGKRKSQIQTFLEQNEGAGLQHLALKTDDIFATIRLMRKAEEELGGFELMKRPSDAYYKELPDRLGDQLTAEQYQELEELGILADADDEGLLLQIFTKPIGDRPTFFFEIIQRVGCLYKPDDNSEIEVERPGCGGFGMGNFRELFKAIEEHEKTLKV
jgi:4-hydroxyphenylpyruvate dioxygenase